MISAQLTQLAADVLENESRPSAEEIAVRLEYLAEAAKELERRLHVAGETIAAAVAFVATDEDRQRADLSAAAVVPATVPLADDDDDHPVVDIADRELGDDRVDVVVPSSPPQETPPSHRRRRRSLL